MSFLDDVPASADVIAQQDVRGLLPGPADAGESFRTLPSLGFEVLSVFSYESIATGCREWIETESESVAGFRSGPGSEGSPEFLLVSLNIRYKIKERPETLSSSGRPNSPPPELLTQKGYLRPPGFVNYTSVPCP